MADYSADPLWDEDGVMMELDDLPVSGSIKKMLRGWAEWFEHKDGGGCAPTVSPDWDPEAFSRFGLFLARQVKRELPGWTVVYFDESKLVRAPDHIQERSEFEYEITGERR